MKNTKTQMRFFKMIFKDRECNWLILQLISGKSQNRQPGFQDFEVSFYNCSILRLAHAGSKSIQDFGSSASVVNF